MGQKKTLHPLVEWDLTAASHGLLGGSLEEP